MSTPRKRFASSIKAMEFDEETLDRAHAAYCAEAACWRIMRHGGGMHDYQIIREDRMEAPIPEGPGSDSITYQIIRCEGARSYTDAEIWLDRFRGRAAMRAALGAL
jgi:hypothetical protein